MKNQKCYRILETLKYCFSSEKKQNTSRTKKGDGRCQDEETYSRGGWFVNQGRQSDATAGGTGDWSLSAFRSLPLTIYPPSNLPKIYPTMCLSIYLSIYKFFNIFIYPTIDQFFDLFIHPFAFSFIYLFI